ENVVHVVIPGMVGRTARALAGSGLSRAKDCEGVEVEGRTYAPCESRTLRLGEHGALGDQQRERGAVMRPLVAVALLLRFQVMHNNQVVIARGRREFDDARGVRGPLVIAVKAFLERD